jgi:hypothetical protein
VEHRLAVLMAADVVGCSLLMGIDGEGTLAALGAVRCDLIDPKIDQHKSRILPTMGTCCASNSAAPSKRCHARSSWGERRQNRGAHDVANVARPVRVFRIAAERRGPRERRGRLAAGRKSPISAPA